MTAHAAPEEIPAFAGMTSVTVIPGSTRDLRQNHEMETDR